MRQAENRNSITKKTCALIMTLVIVLSVIMETACISGVSAASKPIKVKVTGAEVRKFLHDSCFIGNSVQMGREIYTKKYWNSKMGKPLFMTRVSYSFLNDRYKNSGYMIKYKGRTMQARYAVRKSKRKNVFLCMGTNDLGAGVSTSYKNYLRYIKEIHKTNPKARIFIEACPPMRSDKAVLNNRNIRSLNKKMKKYAAGSDYVWYVEVNKPLRDSRGKLKSSYCSDNYVHITPAGVKKWNSITLAYVKDFLENEKIKKVKEKRAEAERRRKAAPNTEIVRWSKKTKHLYWNNDKIVKGIAVYKDKFYAFGPKGKYKPKRTKKLRAAAKPQKPVGPLLKLLGKPKSTTYQDSCYGDPGEYQEGFIEYKKFVIQTLKKVEDGTEIIYGVTSKY